MGIADSTFRGAVTRYMQSLYKQEKCYYCKEEGRYNDMLNTKFIVVCKTHIGIGLSS
jgi:hypothetical protein